MMQRRKNNFDTFLNDDILVEGSSMAVFPAFMGVFTIQFYGVMFSQIKNLSEVSTWPISNYSVLDKITSLLHHDHFQVI